MIEMTQVGDVWVQPEPRVDLDALKRSEQMSQRIAWGIRHSIRRDAIFVDSKF